MISGNAVLALGSIAVHIHSDEEVHTPLTPLSHPYHTPLTPLSYPSHALLTPLTPSNTPLTP